MSLLDRPMALLTVMTAVVLVVAVVGVAYAFGARSTRVQVPYPNSGSYYQRTTSVPPGNGSGDPVRVAFYGATFSLWWPPPPPNGTVSSGVSGVDVVIDEPSGVIDSTSTYCAACGSFTDSWYSSDGSVGIQWTADPAELGVVTLLVEAPPPP